MIIGSKKNSSQEYILFDRLSEEKILFIDLLRSISLEDEQKESVPQDFTSAVDSNVNSSNKKEELKLFLAEVADNRKRNELIYGYKVGVSPQNNEKEWGIEASETAGVYKRDLDSTITRENEGWAEFAISYDNKFFLSATSADSERNRYPFNHTTMGCGTFLKAAGKLKIEKDKLTISPYSQYLTLGPAYLPIILSVLREKEYIISDTNTFIVNEKGDPHPYVEVVTSNYSSRLDPVFYYQGGNSFFPSAKAIAENKKLSIEARLSELFLNIDDEILSAKRQDVIRILNATRAVLKVDIVGFLSLLVETNLREAAKRFSKQEQEDVAENNLPNLGEVASKQKQDVIETNVHAVGEERKESKKQEQDEDSLAVISQETIYQRYKKIITHIETFQSHNIDISFVRAELWYWFFYLFARGFQTDSKMAMMTSEKEGPALAELQEIEADLTKVKETPSILPQRFIIECEGTVSPFIRFYTENPIKTCIALLRDYTKGGFFGRLFSGAWRRHHIKRVEQFLERYESQRFADNLSIQSISQELLGWEGALEAYPDKQRGTLFARLWFCAKQNNEIPNESRNQALVDTPSSQTSEKTEVEEERQEVTETLPSATATTGETAITDSSSDSSSSSALEKTSAFEMPRVSSGGGIFHKLPPDESEGAVSNDKQASPARSPTLSSPSLSESS